MVILLENRETVWTSEKNVEGRPTMPEQEEGGRARTIWQEDIRNGQESSVGNVQRRKIVDATKPRTFDSRMVEGETRERVR